MSAIWDIKTLGWWVSDDSLPLYGSLAALCPDHAPEEDYPEVMEGDWARIEDRMNALLEDGKPGYDDYEEGYALLEDRCKKYAEKD
ncbi:hypothetical protein NSA19_01055 [Actinomyces bowdenii]|uniref:hypothetical protein n=1 Tax=Actinomyces bowdenii TaxID=131109 RepID=UPI00214C691C|nr:hypothetical protein [Actinomyces bowdenii]MCR2051465.1 hypothetical protein [Actinomyces bowdenii]